MLYWVSLENEMQNVKKKQNIFLHLEADKV